MDRIEARLRDWERRLEARENELEQLATFLHERIAEVSKRAVDLARAADKALAVAQGEHPPVVDDAEPASPAPRMRAPDQLGTAPEPVRAAPVEQPSPEPIRSAPVEQPSPEPIRSATVEQALLRAAQLGATGSDAEQIRHQLRREVGDDVIADEAVGKLLELDRGS